jgi:hypothetical protein
MTKTELIKKIEDKRYWASKQISPNLEVKYNNDFFAGVVAVEYDILDLIKELDDPADKEPCDICFHQTNIGDRGNVAIHIFQRGEYVNGIWTDEIEVKYCPNCGRKLGGDK